MSLTPIALGNGLAPAVSIVDGLVYVAVGTTAGLRLRVYTPLGVLVRDVTIAEGFFNSFPRFDGPWLVYRQNAGHGFAAAALHVTSGEAMTFGPAGGNYGLTVNAALRIAAFEQQHADRSWGVWFADLSTGAYAETPLEGAPDGLDRIVSASVVTLRNATRLAVPGVVYPDVSGDLTVGERPDSGIAVQLAGDVMRVLLSGNCNDPRGATDGTTYAIACWGDPGGVRLVITTRAELAALPPAAPPVSFVRLNRPALVGAFNFNGERVPFGNCALDVRDGLARATDGSTLLRYVAGSSDSDVAALSAAIAAAPHDLPVVAYWTHQAQAVGLPAGALYIGIECYWLVSETRAAFKARIQRAVDAVRAAGLWPVYIAQGYTSNTNNTTDLLGVLAALSEVIAANPLVDPIVLVFSGAGRPTGLTDHPDALDAWTSFAGFARDGVVIHHPAPPQPAPVPAPPPVPPVPRPVFPTGDFMLIDPSKTLLLVSKVNAHSTRAGLSLLDSPAGRRISIQPDGSVGDRDLASDGGYESCQITGNLATFQPVDGKFYTFGFVAVDKL